MHKRKNFLGRPLLASFPETAQMLACGETEARRLAAIGELETVQHGKGKRVVVDSIYAHVERLRKPKATSTEMKETANECR